jgi:hypothetical protein
MRTNKTMATELESIAMVLHLKGEPAGDPSDYDRLRGLWREGMPTPAWQCGACGREYSLLDGTVVFGPNSGCACSGMPETVRITRAAREITKMAEEMGEALEALQTSRAAAK